MQIPSVQVVPAGQSVVCQTARPSRSTHSLLDVSERHSRSPRTHSSGRGVEVAVAVAVSVVVIGMSVLANVVVSMTEEPKVVLSITVRVAGPLVVL